MEESEVERVVIFETDPDVVRAYRRLLNVAFRRAAILAAATRDEVLALCGPPPDAFLIGADFGLARGVEDLVLILELRARHDGPIVVISDYVSFELGLQLEALDVITLRKPRRGLELLDGYRPKEQGERLAALLSKRGHTVVLPHVGLFMHIVRLLRRLPGTIKKKLATLEALDHRSVIKAAGSVNAAAKVLGMDQSNLRRKLRALDGLVGVEDDEGEKRRFGS